jgi:hypothetical protein
MLKIFLTLVALFLAHAVSGSALAAQACWKCCPGSGHTPEGADQSAVIRAVAVP